MSITDAKALRALCERSGVLPHEMSEDPEHGLLISPAGVQKLRAIVPPSLESARIGQAATEVARKNIRRVK